MNETFEIARKNMVINQLRPNKINEENILNIFANIPKENYLPGDFVEVLVENNTSTTLIGFAKKKIK